MGRYQLGLPYRPRNGPDALPIDPVTVATISTS